jgi:peptidoglycan-associated lipoprotein
MNKTILIGMSAIALSLGACAKRTPPPAAVTEPPPAATTQTNTNHPKILEVVELPPRQADFVAKAG